MWFYAVAAFVFASDQVSKLIVRSTMDVGDTLTYGALRFTRYENSGMAGSHFQGYAWLFGIVAVAFIAGAVYYRRNAERKKAVWRDIGLGFLVGGAAGNGIDRLLLGSVTDFVERGGGILNLADHAIEAGILLLLASAVLEWAKERRIAKT